MADCRPSLHLRRLGGNLEIAAVHLVIELKNAAPSQWLLRSQSGHAVMQKTDWASILPAQTRLSPLDQDASGQLVMAAP